MADKAPVPSKIVLTKWQNDLANYFRAMVPGIFVQTSEEERFKTELLTVLLWLNQQNFGARELLIWSDASYRKVTLFKQKGDVSPDNKPKVEILPNAELFEVLQTLAKPDAVEPVRHAACTLVICDFAHALESATTVRCLRETLTAITACRKTIILVGRAATLPKEVETDIVPLPYELPSTDHLQGVATDLLSQYPSFKGYEQIQIDKESIRPFARAASGVTEAEMCRMIALSLVNHRAFDNRAIALALAEKSAIVKRSKVLECQNPTEGLDQVGGLQNVKEWIGEVTPILQRPDEAKSYGLQLPAGLLLLGVPGNGKSLVARTLAAHWKLPLLRFDVGRAFGSLVGESEANIREMISVANAVRPAVLLIDEVEKGLGGDSLDGGTTARVMASLLTWLEEKPDDVFVVATANDLRRLQRMPELISRFSDAFFVDLPDQGTRKDILKIHVAQRGHTASDEDLGSVAKLTKGFSGRELRNLVRKALGLSFRRKLPGPTLVELQAAATAIVPTSKTMRESIADLRKWCLDGRARPAGSLFELEDAGVKSNGELKPNRDMPDVFSAGG